MTTGRPLDIRPPAWARVLGPLFLVVWVAWFLLGEQAPVRPLGLAVALLAVLVVGRLFFTSVIGTPDGRLTVRNVWSTRTFAREEIDGVGVDRVPRRGWAVLLVLADGGTHRLDVTEAPFLGPSQAVLERQAGEVRAWLEGRPPPAARDTR